MTLGDIDVWTENWMEQTGRQRLALPRRDGSEDSEGHQVG